MSKNDGQRKRQNGMYLLAKLFFLFFFYIARSGEEINKTQYDPFIANIFHQRLPPQPEQIILSARVGRKIQDVTLSVSPRDSKTE